MITGEKRYYSWYYYYLWSSEMYVPPKPETIIDHAVSGHIVTYTRQYHVLHEFISLENSKTS